MAAIVVRYSFLCWALGLCLLTATGCASTENPKVRDDIEALKEKVWALQKQNAELGLKVAYNSNTLALLRERTEAGETQPVAPHVGVADAPKTHFPKRSIAVVPSVAPAPVKTAPKPVIAQKKEGTPEVMVATTKKDPPVLMAQSTERTLAPLPEFKKLSVEKMYRHAMTLFNKREYAMAVAEFDYLIRRTPNHTLAPKAQFWVGEAFYVQKRYAEAIEEYRKVLLRWPDSASVPDTLLKQGLALIALDRRTEGREVLQRLVETKKDNPAAASAARALEDMEQGD